MSTTKTTFNLFFCHLLSTWNARSYEFASVLFTAAAFPEGLSAASWILALIIFASSLGRWVDHGPSRLQTLLTTVTVNRIVVILACSCWAVIVTRDGHDGLDVPTESRNPEQPPRPLAVGQFKDAVFLIILALGFVERLSRVANLISIERDWVPTLATVAIHEKEPAKYELTQLNAVMSRIDLICKLGAPIMMSVFMSATKSTWLGAVAMIVLNLLTWPLEYWTARKAWHGSLQLQELKNTEASSITTAGAGDTNSDGPSIEHGPFGLRVWDRAIKIMESLVSWLRNYALSLRLYFTTDIWMPSLAMTGLHFSVLVFSGTLTVFLVNSGFSLKLITGAEVLSAVFELSSTYVFPWGVRILSAQRTTYHALASSEIEDEDQMRDESLSQEYQRRGVSTLGIWALALMLLCLSQQSGKCLQDGREWIRVRIPQHNKNRSGKLTISLSSV
ncbi:hypothetical protein OEA41_007452 [Lepraria neglecta]|uniref:Solute carrier family 40 member n=1 Tax=Lepraria neglecta TaxID=209136 RepID=A0AAE0DQH2_9LECA|nr:hypothetical protein OEA41_007452 [Lepraria neglecta]